MRSIFAALLCFVAISVNAPAQEKIRVVTRNIEPFSFEKDGRRTGFAAELWDNVARELKVEFEYTVVPSAKDMVAAVQNQQADVAVGALSITSERETLIDFSQPFYESGLQIAVANTDGGLGGVVWAALRSFFTWQLITGFVVAIVIMFLISHLVWMYEHPVNEEQWPKAYLAGMGESFWWTLSIFLVGGADNKGPVCLGGRIVATVWMLASVIAVSILTASLSAVFTVNSLSGEINGSSDLPGRKVATIGGSTAEAWLKKMGADGGPKVQVEAFPTVPDCLAALKNGKVKAVVYDGPILKYYVGVGGGDYFRLVPALFEKNNYGFGLQQGSPLRKRINQALLKLNENGVSEDLRRRFHLGDEGE